MNLRWQMMVKKLEVADILENSCFGTDIWGKILLGNPYACIIIIIIRILIIIIEFNMLK